MNHAPRMLLPLSLLASVNVAAAQDQPAPTLAAFRAEIDRIRAPSAPWRAVPWKSCLLDGIRESRKSHKPIMLWIFIDRPIDDARC